MTIYTLTQLGKRMARSTMSGDTAGWRIVHYLDKVGQSTGEQIAQYCGLTGIQAGMALRVLQQKGIVARAGSTVAV